MPSKKEINYTLFPRAEVFTAFSDVFTQRSFVIVPAIMKAASRSDSAPTNNKNPNVMRSITRLLIHTNQIEAAVSWAVSEQLMMTKSRKEIFRETSLASTLIRWTFRTLGSDYLRTVLKGPIQALCASEDNLEIDPLVITDDSEREKNIAALTKWSTIFMESLFKGEKLIPHSLRKICSIIREKVEMKYDDRIDEAVDSIYLDVISNFMILRFISLAIISPNEYLQIKNITNSIQRRNLVQVAKVTQAIAYGVPFLSFFDVMNPLMQSYHGPYVEFLKKNLRSSDEDLECSDCNPEPLLATKIDVNSSKMREECSLVIKFLGTLDVDLLIKDTMADWYPHVKEDTGAFTQQEMLEVFDCYSKLGWLAKTKDWFDENDKAKSLPLPSHSTKFNKLLNDLPSQPNSRPPPKISKKSYSDFTLMIPPKRVVDHVLVQSASAPRSLRELRSASLTTEEIAEIRKTVDTPISPNSYDAINSWFDGTIQSHRFVVLIFMRGMFCLWCKSHMTQWSAIASAIRKAGGELYGITAESTEAAQKINSKWDLSFEVISDPLGRLANSYNVILESADLWSSLGQFEYVINQPAILAVSQEGEMLYYWRSIPAFNNLWGAAGRPEPVEVFDLLLENLGDLESSSTSSDEDHPHCDIDELVEMIKTMDTDWIRKIVKATCESDELGVAMYDELKRHKKRIREAKKRLDRKDKLVRKNLVKITKKSSKSSSSSFGSN